MYISKIKLNNFRSFSGSHTLDFKQGINFFVGNNNSGKTTIFRSIEFLQSAKSDEGYITKGKESETVSVEITFSGDDIPQIVSEEGLKKYQTYVFEENGTQNLRICRSSKEEEINQNGKKKNLGIKSVRTWNQETQQFENPTGIDTTISALFDAQFVYSDLKNEDYQDFGKTKIVGKLINAITSNFQKSEPYKNFCQAHEIAFGNGGLLNVLRNTQEKIQEVMSEQYGNTEVEFHFDLPEVENFFKNGNITLTDNGITTDVSQKGTGMQRALAMSLIQVYSEVANTANSKQLLFFIDEPETFLHPQAQDKLISSFETISESSQVFITTHSPYLLKKFKNQNHDIKIFSPQGEKVLSGQNMDLFPFSPTWGEINYFAFNVASVEFHNELFGYLQESCSQWSEKEFDNWLSQNEIVRDMPYIRENRGNSLPAIYITLPMYIRNLIHHPENRNNVIYTSEQLRNSIDKMVKLVREMEN